MKLHHLLDPYVIHKLNKIRGPSPVTTPSRHTPQDKEPVAKRAAGSFHLSERDVKDLMGMHRDRYHKQNGKVER